MATQYVRLGCGIDVSSKKLDVCFGGYTTDGSFKIIASKKTFKNTPVDINRLISWTQNLLTKHNAERSLPFQVVVETTGTYHENVLAAFYAQQLPICLQQAERAKKFLLSLGQITKNDQVDAKGLCRLACERKLRSWKPFSEHIMFLRGVLRQRNALIKSRTCHKNQLHALKAGHYANRVVVKSIKAIIKALDKQIEQLESEILNIYHKDETLQKYINPIVSSLSGVGMITLLTVFAETNGFDRISSRRALSRYAGLNVIQNQSGFTTRRTKISKRGNARIRSTLYMCALSVIRSRKGPMYGKYLRIVQANPKARKVGVVALMRTILEMIYTLFKTEKPYDPEHVWAHSPPKANHPSTEKQNASEKSSEARGIALSEERLPIVA